MPSPIEKVTNFNKVYKKVAASLENLPLYEPIALDYDYGDLIFQMIGKSDMFGSRKWH